jgi:hypothetical protein
MCGTIKMSQNLSTVVVQLKRESVLHSLNLWIRSQQVSSELISAICCTAPFLARYCPHKESISPPAPEAVVRKGFESKRRGQEGGESC